MSEQAQKQQQAQPAPDEGVETLQSLNKEIEQLATDPAAVAQIDRDYAVILKDFAGDSDLKDFRLQFESLYNALKQSISTEQGSIRRCKDHAQEISLHAAKLDGVQKMIQLSEENLEIGKHELDEKKKFIEEQKDRKVDIQEKIDLTKEQLSDLQRMTDTRLEKIEQQNDEILRGLRKAKEESEKNSETLGNKIKHLKNDNEHYQMELQQEEKANTNYQQEVRELEQKTIKYKEDTKTQEARKDEMNTAMEVLKEKIDKAKEESKKKLEAIQQYMKEQKLCETRILSSKAEKNVNAEESKKLKKQMVACQEELRTQSDQLKQIEDDMEVQRIEMTKCIEEENLLKRNSDNLKREYEKINAKKLALEDEITQLKQRHEQAHAQNQIEIESVETLTRQRLELKEKIDSILKQRTQNNSALKKAEDEEHHADEEIIYQLNKLKKIENQILGYEAENEKLRKMITQLQKEQEKYGIEASQAHAKYYQTCEEVKIKINQIAEQKQKNSAVLAKLKHQQHLYEAVRSDRNLYSKNLLDCKKELTDLQEKKKRNKQMVDQYKEEIKQKDNELINQDYEYNKIVEENKKTELEKERIAKAIKSTEEVIKNQESHVSRLKYIIQELKGEKQRHDKDLDMVINERDILGTQLIKRNQELAVLEEKIKLQQSNLAKGEIVFRKKEEDLVKHKSELTNLINELKSTQEQISCIPDLRNEINSLSKDILSEKTKVKALQDELENPLNVHRWRKLEVTDQETFERILKMQTLQRRLIAKTEEVQEKEAMIKEKEKLFMELKQILARQPGPEIQTQLASYKENLKEKTSQMKKMLNELTNSREQVNILKFENNRLREELVKMKKEYFAKRRDQDNPIGGQENDYSQVRGSDSAFFSQMKDQQSTGQSLQLGGGLPR